MIKSEGYIESEIGGTEYIEADAIIFDKDGTLLDFDAFWIPITEVALGQIMKRLNMECVPAEKLLSALGVFNGLASIDGVLCYGTYAQMAEAVYPIFREYGYTGDCDTIERHFEDTYAQSISYGEIKPTCPDLAKTLSELKRRGKRLAVVTCDNREMTMKCLNGLGITDFFDRIYTDEKGMPQKPDPYYLLDFCSSLCINPARTVMVGDTLTDLLFARNSGAISVAIVKGELSDSKLYGKSDVLISKISQLTDLIR